MAYSALLKRAIGVVRSSLEAADVRVYDPKFREHGHHEIDQDAPVVLIACSGGRDSLALAAIARIVTRAWGMRCGAVIVDHQLQEGSHEIAQHAAAQCEQLQLSPVMVRSIDVPCSGRGTEADARDARYAALIECAHQYHARAVLLAHTSDDQAETMLIDMFRAAGTDAFAGMSECIERDGIRFVRPILALSREDTTNICKQLHLEWWDDPTNGDAYASDEVLPQSFPLRSRIRHTLVPILNKFFGCDVVDRLCATARVTRRDVEFIQAQAEYVYTQAVSYTDGQYVLDVPCLVNTHAALRFRVIAKVTAQLPVAVGAQQINAIESLISNWHGQHAVSLPGKYYAQRNGHVIVVCKDKSHANRGCARQN